MLDLFVKIGFIEITIWDVLDILIVGYLLYQIFKLLRGSLAFNIVIALFVFYILSELVDFLEMSLLSKILGQFVNLGVLALLILFQPEVRRFLIVLGKQTVTNRIKFWKRFVRHSKTDLSEAQNEQISMITKAVGFMKEHKTGALIVFTTDTALLSGHINSGTSIGAAISDGLIESIFNKESPLHDGAMIICDGRIHKAACVLPVSDSQDLPQHAGLRHRAAVGITERTNVTALIVSEETGNISIAKEGKLRPNIDFEALPRYLRPIFREFIDHDE